MEKSCLVKFNPEGKGIDITYVGEWQRSDVDKVHVAMFKELPKHLVERREEIEKLRKEKENG